MPTVILRPTADITNSATNNLSRSSGDKYYTLINEEIADNDSSYIYYIVSSSTTYASNSASVKIGWNMPNKIKLLSVNLHVVNKTTTSNRDPSNFTIMISLNGTDILINGRPKSEIVNGGIDFNGLSDSLSALTTAYTDKTKQTIVDGFKMVGLSNNIIDVTEIVADGFASGDTFFEIDISLGGRKSQSKNDDFQIRLTQLYLEIEYEEVVENTNTLYFKKNGSYVAATKVYKKVSGAWVEQTDLPAIFSGESSGSASNYVYGGSV